MQIIQVDQASSLSALEAQSRAEYDTQIATAKRYPRDLTRAKNNSIAIVTMDKKTAETCRYALPRGGKTISGPSVHMARIMAQQYGNLRVTAAVKMVMDREIVSEAVAFDLETNYAVKVEVHRRITQKDGSRYNDDNITVTGNAANAIALRNAILNVIPKSVTDAVYNAALEKITGDLSDETKLIARRNDIFQKMKDAYNVKEDQILQVLNLKSINQVKVEQISDLIAIGQAIKDGDTTVEEVFYKTTTKDISGEAKAVADAMDKAINGKKPAPAIPPNDLFDGKKETGPSPVDELLREEAKREKK